MSPFIRTCLMLCWLPVTTLGKREAWEKQTGIRRNSSVITVTSLQHQIVENLGNLALIGYRSCCFRYHQMGMSGLIEKQDVDGITG